MIRTNTITCKAGLTSAPMIWLWERRKKVEKRIEARERIERRRLTQLGRFDACPGLWDVDVEVEGPGRRDEMEMEMLGDGMV